jgi:lysophospholipase L1-like esterase
MSYNIIKSLDPASTTFAWSKMSWYHEQVKNSDTLLMVFGDSWTWGDGLGKTNGGIISDDLEYRLTHIYGNVLANMLDADLVNAARPGASNHEIYSNVKNFLPEVVDRYKKIYVVITLTENGREFNHGTDWYIIEDLGNPPDTLSQVLEKYEARMFDVFAKLIDQYSKVEFVLARNFTFSFESNKHILGNLHAGKTWVEILAENQPIQQPYPSAIRMLSHSAFDPLQDYLTNYKLFSKYKLEMFDIMCDRDAGLTWLANSIFNNKIHTRHPNADGHQLWAKYLYDNFARNHK